VADDDVIRSQLPGIFYRRPDPDSDVFAEVGDEVQAGSVVGLVEVMKQFHEVTAESAGTIASFEVDNEQVVSPGEVVARLESTG
jgi:acetyl-CoA carboxylase biotin carboxyl carrier protein